MERPRSRQALPLRGKKRVLFSIALVLPAILALAGLAVDQKTDFVILISANAEWKPVRELFRDVETRDSPFGEWFSVELKVAGQKETVIFFHGGWGKISAAASTQYVIDRWAPVLLVNLGTCGGFEGEVKRGETILVERTLVYDIVEQMGDSSEAIAEYTTDIDLSWLSEPLPFPVRRSLLISADRDIVAKEITRLKTGYRAIAGDWESGAIAWVAGQNGTRCLILRTVSDVVSARGSETYGDVKLFEERTREIMKRLIDSLPAWLAKARS